MYNGIIKTAILVWEIGEGVIKTEIRQRLSLSSRATQMM